MAIPIRGRRTTGAPTGLYPILLPNELKVPVLRETAKAHARR
ncbi:MAG TPA: hypothetical protein PK430_10435 [Muribaculum sp.]|nr:hypothetical protein [Muribaculum sp.]